ncbi:uncharacterized protein LOC111009030 [Momordica charantia]|uniref:Uncharacterized protein LOC111009030 n=1 Tax=Momordica charantia TaxID=3673 RepID=A0A6J1CAV3_MOMCH|nr:uncharacterized protein LOC111009030 [Momordica charantia]
MEAVQDMIKFSEHCMIGSVHLRFNHGILDLAYHRCWSPNPLFALMHDDLLGECREQIRITAFTCMSMATLIIIVVSIASFMMSKANYGHGDSTTNNNIIIIHTFWQNHGFTVFRTLNIVSVVSSITSILGFLFLLLPRHFEGDFLELVPIKLMMGLMMLFVAGVCMVLAFSVIFFTANHQPKAKPLVAIGAASTLPFCYVCVVHSKLVVGFLRFSYWYKFSLKRCKRKLLS